MEATRASVLTCTSLQAAGQHAIGILLRAKSLAIFLCAVDVPQALDPSGISITLRKSFFSRMLQALCCGPGIRVPEQPASRA